MTIHPQVQQLIERIPPMNFDLEREFTWALKIAFADEQYLVGWYKVRSDFYLGVWLLGKDVMQEVSRGPAYDAVRAAAQAFGASMARDRLSLRNAFTLSLEEMVLTVVAEAHTGAYVGQSSGILYVQDVARVLDYDVSLIWEACDKLRADRKIGLDVAMIIPIEWDDRNRQRGFESTGHLDLRLSDFGGWSCGACGQCGNPDEGDAYASDLPCVKQE